MPGAPRVESGSVAWKLWKEQGVRIGTASWTDKTLIDSGAFYPSDAKKAEERLAFYAENFATLTQHPTSARGLELLEDFRKLCVQPRHVRDRQVSLDGLWPGRLRHVKTA